ncbi:hypothetical protein CYY_005722 [Polysphondylium violaceum]|uniref:Uncharacterized protein n=1 Tax=Polysphondylium violaceum TaxID=133409 RepID=A0A8J4Q2H9_9MYCE|nr:hypothetical protein CYY_005722 [Polysphondylium violaceum]
MKVSILIDSLAQVFLMLKLNKPSPILILIIDPLKPAPSVLIKLVLDLNLHPTKLCRSYNFGCTVMGTQLLNMAVQKVTCL